MYIFSIKCYIVHVVHTLTCVCVYTCHCRGGMMQIHANPMSIIVIQLFSATTWHEIAADLLTAAWKSTFTMRFTSFTWPQRQKAERPDRFRSTFLGGSLLAAILTSGIIVAQSLQKTRPNNTQHTKPSSMQNNDCNRISKKQLATSCNNGKKQCDEYIDSQVRNKLTGRVGLPELSQGLEAWNGGRPVNISKTRTPGEFGGSYHRWGDEI